MLVIRPEWTEFAVRSLIEAVNDEPRFWLYVAHRGDDPVATIAVTPRGTVIEAVDGVGYRFVVPDAADVAWFDDLHVAPSAQGDGVAVATIVAAMAEAGHLGFCRVEGRTRTPLPQRIVDLLGVADLGTVELPDGSLGYLYGKDL